MKIRKDNNPVDTYIHLRTHDEMRIYNNSSHIPSGQHLN